MHEFMDKEKWKESDYTKNKPVTTQLSEECKMHSSLFRLKEMSVMSMPTS